MVYSDKLKTGSARSILCLSLALALTSCGAEDGGGATTLQSADAFGAKGLASSAASALSPPNAGVPQHQLSADPRYLEALAVWREARAKDACSSCHGADFFDLARVGTSDVDIVRRALGDGADQAEANALVTGVHLVRAAYALAPENPRTFRPFQPGGAVLPGASNIERDIAFGNELVTAMPTLAGFQRIATLADAKRARDEFLAVDFDRLKIGVPFPIWSADIAHGSVEGTMNDWVADVPRVPKPERAAEWTALQDAYLADPTDLNFWRMYAAVDDMTMRFPLTPVDPKEGWKAATFTSLKFKSALIGQHAMRVQALNRTGFMRGQMAFAYLATEAPFAAAFRGRAATYRVTETVPAYLPNPMWEVGDHARFAFRPSGLTAGQPGNTGDADKVRDQLRLLGYPQFVIDSIDPGLLARDMQKDLMLQWFMIGMRFDPGLQRITQSGSTVVGEYLQGQLSEQDYFIHRTFQTGLRNVVRVYRPEAVWNDAPVYNLKFGYFNAYGRHTPTRWNSKGEERISAALKAEQIAAYKRITANMFRMSLLLHEEELDRQRIAPYGSSALDGEYAGINEFFRYANQPGRAEDDALLRRVAAKSGTRLAF